MSDLKIHSQESYDYLNMFTRVSQIANCSSTSSTLNYKSIYKRWIFRSKNWSALAHHLGEIRNLTWNMLHYRDQRIMSAYSINASLWEVIRSAVSLCSCGKPLIVPDDVENLSLIKLSQALRLQHNQNISDYTLEGLKDDSVRKISLFFHDSADYLLHPYIPNPIYERNLIREAIDVGRTNLPFHNTFVGKNFLDQLHANGARSLVEALTIKSNYIGIFSVTVKLFLYFLNVDFQKNGSE